MEFAGITITTDKTQEINIEIRLDKRGIVLFLSYTINSSQTPTCGRTLAYQFPLFIYSTPAYSSSVNELHD